MLRARAIMTLARLCLPIVVSACLVGCDQSRARREHLVSRYPLDRVQAAVQLAEAGDAEAVDMLIELLDDRDRGVRMYTILALERLCGRTYGYRYYDPEPARAAAVARWREARLRGEVTVQRAPAPPARQRAAAVTDSSGPNGERKRAAAGEAGEEGLSP